MLGAFLALWTFIGRWTPGRFVGDQLPLAFMLDSRFLISLLVFVVASLEPYRRQRVPATGRPTRRALQASSFLLLVPVYMLASSLWQTSSTEYSQSKIGHVLVLTVVLLVTALFILTDGRPDDIVRTFWTSCWFLGWALAIPGVMAAVGSSGRIAVLGGGPNTLGRLMALWTIAGAWLLWAEAPRHYTRRILYVLSMAGGVVLALGTGSRGAVAGFVVAATYLLLRGGAVHIRSRSRRLGLLLIAATSVALLLQSGPLDAVAEVTEARFADLTFLTSYDSGRGAIFAEASRCIQESPVVGIGLGGFDAFHDLSTVARYPHNTVLEVACEGGLIGAALLIVTGLLLARAVVGHPKSPADHFAIALLLLWLVASMVSGDLYDARGLAVAALLLVRPQALEPRTSR